jgi:hypothetical protein
MMDGKKFALLLFCVFATAAPLYAQAAFGTDQIFSPPSSVSCSYEPGDSDNWIILSLVALMVGLMIAAGMYALSGVLNTPKLQSYLRDKLWDFVETFVLVALIGSAWFLGLGAYGRENIDTARAYSVIIRNTMMLDFAIVVGGSIIFSFFANVTPMLHPFGDKLGLYLSFQLAPMFRPVFDLLGILIQMLTIGTLSGSRTSSCCALSRARCSA